MKLNSTKLKARRKLLGMTQAGLAAASGVPGHVVANLEAGRVSMPGYAYMVNIGKALQVDPSIFFDADTVDSQEATA